MTVSITLATTTNRTTVVTDTDKTLADVLNENNFPMSGVTYHVDCQPVSDTGRKLGELNVKDGSMVMSVPAQKAGC